MQITLSPQSEAQLRSLMQDGQSADDLVAQAIAEKLERESTVAGIQRGLDDVEAGRVQTWEEVNREIREKHGFSFSS
ncbi:hypothetical protein [Calycomorphotria hydatis]|uniref:Antitoxin ParD4 n=1 Tax=Calycomorphotria hydatis TaxID=2528027 RepID=A0A517T4Q2_9PLAN|nr:hypothetical protein [Calycomorphotria hydatis]QDT63350.1 hypothetical protein V22_05710 [Calycomorphotria hydatis]